MFAGPGAGKSTLASGLFHLMKLNNIDVELITEYAKDKVWENSAPVLQDQLYVFAKQHHRQFVLRGKVDYAITDSPIFLSLIYGYRTPAFDDFIVESFNRYENINVFVRRTKGYKEAGRLQTREQAELIDRAIQGLLDKLNVPYVIFEQYENDDCAARLYDILKERGLL